MEDEVNEWAKASANGAENLIRVDEGRFQVLYGAFGATDFAMLLFLLNVHVSTPTVNLQPPLNATLTGLCAMVLAVALSFFKPFRYLVISAMVFLVGVVASVAAIYWLLEPIDKYAGPLFLALIITIGIVLAISLIPAINEIARSDMDIMRRLRQKPAEHQSEN